MAMHKLTDNVYISSADIIHYIYIDTSGDLFSIQIKFATQPVLTICRDHLAPLIIKLRRITSSLLLRKISETLYVRKSTAVIMVQVFDNRPSVLLSDGFSLPAWPAGLAIEDVNFLISDIVRNEPIINNTISILASNNNTIQHS